MLKWNAIPSIITEPTRRNWQTRTIIDLIHTNAFISPTNPFVVQEMVSNHVSVAAEMIAAESKDLRSEAKKKRLILDTDSEKLYAKAAAFFVNLPTLTPNNFNDSISNFISKVVFLLDNFSKVKHNTRRQRNLNKWPYISKGIIRTKNKLYRTLLHAEKDRKNIL